MKQAKIVASVIFIIIITGGIIEQLYIKKTFSDFEGYTDYFETAMNANDFYSAKSKMDEFATFWDKKSSVLESLAHTRDIKTVTLEISHLNAYITVQNKSEAMVSLITLKSMSDNLEKLLLFRIEHII
ncbi:MAG: DUF4363 family protein [Clostridiales bacterium]|jgi:hypothetical protein|nr:DUF4363 family protein [Clostridiales bacterium]